MNILIPGIIAIILNATFLELKASKNITYVWAPSGLNIRSEPNRYAKIIGVIPYGDSVEIIEKSDFTFTSLFIKSGEDEKHPINLSSNWVKIHFAGKEGFIIDGYLLPFPPPLESEFFDFYLDRMSTRYEIQKLDATYKLRFGDVVFGSEQIVFPGDRRISWSKEKTTKPDDGIETEADYALEDIKYFKGFSRQEILVFLNAFYRLESEKGPNADIDGTYVKRNWTESVFLLGGTLQIELTFYPNEVIVFYFFSSC